MREVSSANTTPSRSRISITGVPFGHAAHAVRTDIGGIRWKLAGRIDTVYLPQTEDAPPPTSEPLPATVVSTRTRSPTESCRWA